MKMRNYFFILFFVRTFFCCSEISAQTQFHFVQPTISHKHFGDSFYRNYFLAGEDVMFFGNVSNITINYGPGFSIPQTPFLQRDYTLPPLPFFCAIEYRNMQRFNIWIKFRAGTDADYEKLIASPHP